MNDLPLISCICVTHKKPDLLIRAVRCFQAQTYQNRELIILFERDDLRTKEVCQQLSEEKIRVLEFSDEPKRTLGHLRNYAISCAYGEYVCQWDDDDWYHMSRLEYQYEAIHRTEYHGCVLSRWIVFDGQTRRSYLSSLRRWEGSILCRKSTMQAAPYLNRASGEDTAVIDTLVDRHQLLTLNKPDLYIYVYHGENTWDRKHWEVIFMSSDELEETDSDCVSAILANGVSVEEGSRTLGLIVEKTILTQL
jgi:glycosyltransferase involved in cell wall biosynthesis